jgi:deoxyadenosine/deoxycytidine kinase
MLKRIALRNRTYERSIDPAYLERLNVLYENWIQHFTLCPILSVPADDLDYVAHPRHLQLIIDKVQEKLTGKEEVIFARDELSQD